ncbi:unnamed protein product [Adineta steineri]|uniref:G domain-containing protein n=1 Tax=Adineta steineri TaxID=433720 RepID=A0A814GI83_9BILA|nr:unnamed protein product [Adineta steineri]CAF3655463.1 unnamed protein product [Adineta steineri]
MNRDINRPISRQALGRTAFLGSLYDATTDEFCERVIVNDDIPAVAIRHLDENHGHSSYEFDTAVSKKLRKLNVDVSLSLSILGGIIKSAGASSSYLYTRDKTSQNIDATFIHRSITRTESLNVSHKELKARVEPTALRHKNATHVVTSIRWGADVFAQFEAKSTTAESKHVAKAGLKLELNKLLSKFVSVNPSSSATAAVEAVKPTSTTTTDGTMTPGTATVTTQVNGSTNGPQISFESTSTATVFNYKITLFGDLIPTTCPKTIEELIAMLPSITTGLQKTNGGKGRPLEYIMLPLSELAEILGEDLSSHKMFRAVEESLTHEIQGLFDDCDQLRIIVHTLHTSIHKVEDFFLEEEINQIDAHQQAMTRVERDIRSRIGKMLVRFRSGQAESSEIDQLLVELETQMRTQKKEIKQLERSDINEKIKYIHELKEKNVIAVREPETLSIIQNRHPKHKLIVLYASNELRISSKDKWITVYYELIRRIEANITSSDRTLFCYFDYDLHPNFHPQHKKLEVREYVGAPVIIPTTRIKPATLEREQSITGVDSLFKNVGHLAAECVSQWQLDAKARLDEMFAKSNSRILLPYNPSLVTRNEVFEKLRRNQKNILLVGRSCIGKSTFKNVLTDPTWIGDALKSYSQTEFPVFSQYSISGIDTILNFIDTPGLFQRTATASSLPDNTTLIQLIDGYIRSKATQLHFLCFFVSVETKVNREDLNVVQTFFDFLGPEIRKNACLIITRCESKSEQQLESMKKDIQTNLDFKVLSSQMKQGLFFTGSINRDDWIDTSSSVYQQFENICEYRNKLLDLFINVDVKPFDLTSNIIARKIKEEIDLRGRMKPK